MPRASLLLSLSAQHWCCVLVQAIALTPLSADGSIPAIKKAVDAGIVVICWGSTINGDLASATSTSAT